MKNIYFGKGNNLTAGLFEYNFADSEITMLFLYMITIPFSLARIQRKDNLKEKKLLK